MFIIRLSNNFGLNSPIWPHNYSSSAAKEIIHHPKSHELHEEFLPTPALHVFPTSDGGEAYALFYPPAHPEYAGTDNEAPPLLCPSARGTYRIGAERIAIRLTVLD